MADGRARGWGSGVERTRLGSRETQHLGGVMPSSVNQSWQRRPSLRPEEVPSGPYLL